MRPINSSGNLPIRISIIDDGIGINPEDMPKLFKPFERIGAERTNIEGAGLGLTVVKKLMDVMSGNVGVMNNPIKGSEFWIELPMTDSQNGQIDKIKDITLPGSAISTMKGNILYIEDNASNAELVEQILSIQCPGIKLITSELGLQAEKLAIEFAPNIILLDLDLPDIYGGKVLTILQENEKTNPIPVIIISADAMPQQIQKLLNMGAKDYLTKPLDILAFLNVIDEWFIS
jgi:CheY-like chemotaxis protein